MATAASIEKLLVKTAEDLIEGVRGGAFRDAQGRARDFRSIGFPESTQPGSGGGGGPSRPTEHAALTQLSDPTNQIKDQGRVLATACLQSIDRLLRWMNSTESGRGTASKMCANTHCPDTVYVSDLTQREVRCDPCQRYRNEHGVDAPQGTLNARNRKRKARA